MPLPQTSLIQLLSADSHKEPDNDQLYICLKPIVSGFHKGGGGGGGLVTTLYTRTISCLEKFEKVLHKEDTYGSCRAKSTSEKTKAENWYCSLKWHSISTH
jgi:hypothetical protein